MSPSTPPRSRLKAALRVAGALLKALAVLLVFVATSSLGLWLHLDTPAAKRLIRTEVQNVLGGALRGQVRLVSWQHISLRGVRGLHGRVFAPGAAAGDAPILEVWDANAEFSTAALLRSLISGQGALWVELPAVDIGSLHVRLSSDAKGQLELAEAFLPRPSATPSGPKKSPSRETVVLIKRFYVAHSWTHGKVGGSPPLDVELNELLADLSLDASQLRLRLHSGALLGRSLPRGLDPRGDITARLDVPSGGALAAQLSFLGVLAGIDSSLAAKYSQTESTVSLKLPRFRSEQLAPLGVPLTPGQLGSLSFEASGPLSRLKLKARLNLAETQLDLSGTASALRPSVNIRGKLRRANLAAIQATLPKTRIDAELEADWQLKQSVSHGNAAVTVAGFELGAWRVPPLRASAELEGSRIWGWVSAARDGAKLKADLDLTLGEPKQPLKYHADLSVKSLRALAASGLAVPLQGALELSSRGQLELRGSGLRTSTRVSARSLSGEGFRVDQAQLSLDTSGKLLSPDIDAKLTASGARARAGGSLIAFSQLSAAARGDTRQLRATAKLVGHPGTPNAALSARVVLTPRVVLRDTRVELSRAGRQAVLSVSRASFSPRLSLVGMDLSGAGQLTGDASLGQRELSAKLRASRLSVSALRELAGDLVPKQLPARGVISLTADLHGQLRQPVGELSVQFEQLGIGAHTATGEATVRAGSDGQLQLSAQLQSASFGSVVLSGRDLLPGGSKEAVDWMDTNAWLRAAGSLRADFAVDAGRLQHTLPSKPDSAQVSGRVRGYVAMTRSPDARAQSSAAIATPDVEASWLTSGFELARPASKAGPASALRGFDVRGALSITGATGHTALQVELVNGSTSLAEAELTSVIPYARWLDKPASIAARLITQPFELTLDAPALQLSTLPSVARPKGIDGSLNLHASATGTLLSPVIRAEAGLRRVVVETLSARPEFSSQVLFEYADSEGRLRLGFASATHSIVRVESNFVLSVPALLKDGLKQAHVDADAVVDELQLESIPTLSARAIRGATSGRLEIRGLGGSNPRGSVELTTRGLQIGDASLGRLRVASKLTERRVELSATTEQDAGFAQLIARAGVSWDGLIPSLADDQPAQLRLLANNWRAAALKPFVQDNVSELDGRLDADAKLDLVGARPKLGGFVRLRAGIVQIPIIGQRFSDVQATARLHPDGNIVVSGGSLRGLSGRAYFDASARLEGLSLAAAQATLRIPKPEAIPMTYEGVSLGSGSGSMQVGVVVKPEVVNIDVAIPNFAFELPANPPSGVQNLKPPDAIRVGSHQARGFVLAPSAAAEPTPKKGAGRATRVSIQLGSHVEIRQGATLRVGLSGKLLIDSARNSAIDGQIKLSGGQIDISGKLFQITEGVITFQDNPANPLVVARASWDAPAGYKVVAEYIGPLDSGHFELRAEPALSQNEIVSLILFGSPDGAVGSGGSTSSSSTAAGVGGGVATAGLNRAIADVTSLDITTRVDTSDAQNPRPELVVQLTPRVSAQVGYNLEEPRPGKSPDRTLFSLEFRLSQRWSLGTTFGDGGSSLVDLLWRYRY